MKTLKGFEVKAFVAEPDIGEAIAFASIFRGRLWTLENYNYQTRKAHSVDKRNRIQILRMWTGMVSLTRKRLYRELNFQLWDRGGYGRGLCWHASRTDL